MHVACDINDVCSDVSMFHKAYVWIFLFL